MAGAGVGTAIGERKMQEENKKINLYFSGNISIPEDFLQKEFLKTYSFGNAVASKVTASETQGVFMELSQSEIPTALSWATGSPAFSGEPWMSLGQSRCKAEKF